MCGRFVSSSNVDDIAQYFAVEDHPEELADPGSANRNFNVAPTSDVLAIFEADGQRRMDRFRWGLVPRWAKDLKIGSRMINARAETVAEKNSFKPALAKRRCIIPVDGFYEWQKLEGTKTRQPMFIHRPDNEPYAFAGLWETWRVPFDAGDGGGENEGASDEDDKFVWSCTIITTAANEAMSPVHDRMPVILAPGDWSRWLDVTNTDVSTVTPLLVPAPDELIAMHSVTTEVNNARNHGAHLIERAEPVTVL